MAWSPFNLAKYLIEKIFENNSEYMEEMWLVTIIVTIPASRAFSPKECQWACRARQNNSHVH